MTTPTRFAGAPASGGKETESASGRCDSPAAYGYFSTLPQSASPTAPASGGNET
ncbi:hypothetical protein BSTEL_0556 [Bifidobacterium stellenboschense]|uniref:Uncharacterized protein n=1 Tax=Bifidobacterium stellenboschense TaxID=762211 RepID=A0A087DJP9_9BIFI|nr:hypothetical protein BSTEL_0556 [Bifidobacterium stellenboschense]